MFDHPIIDVGLGLIFFYVVLSLVASAIQEWIASLFALRSKNLRKGVQNLIGNDYAKKVYEHPLINNLSKDKKLPSYIAPETLSSVLLEIISKEEKNGNTESNDLINASSQVSDLVANIDQKHPLREILMTLANDGEKTVSVLKNKLADWLDEGMARVAGWYKRQAKIFIFAIAFAITLATNASTLHIAEELWQNDALRTQIAAQAQTAVQTGDTSVLKDSNFETLAVFPIGWSSVPSDCLEWLKTLLGWIITTAAVSLGAPFWFDLLGKVANLRGSGSQAQTRKTT